MSKSLAVVIATCREDSMNRWLDAWQPNLADVPVYVIEDSPAPKMKLHIAGYKHVTRWSWHGIDGELGDKSWIIPRRTSAIKSFGFLKAYREGHDYIWTLDDDCLPETEENRAPYVHTLKQFLGMSQARDSWYNTIEEHGLYPRGYPYGIRQEADPVMIHHGLWSGVPDLDGITALEHHKVRLKPATGIERVPTGQMFPMCGMNLVFRREMTPAMYFGLQGRKRDNIADHIFGEAGTDPLPFDRFDDIWAGLFAKKICDHLGYAVTSGAPSILHTKESDPTQRVIKEGPGIAAHELLWQMIAGYQIPNWADTVKSSYMQLCCLVNSSANELPYPDYWKKLADAMQLWTEMF